MITLKGGIGNFISLKNRQYSYFAGNNYLGLANHPEMIKEVTHSLEKYGINFSASRQTTGTSDIHLQLEELLANFKNCEDAIIFASGYMGNSLLLNILKDSYSAIFADSMAHPSILDGIPKDISHVNLYDRKNVNHLEDLLKKQNNHRPLIITDGIFALTGEIAPLNQIYSLVEKYDALLIVDDAHSTGVLGENGRGTPEHFQLAGAMNIYQSETMSKAMGAYGGFISAENKIIQKIRSKSTFYGASTALPPPIVAAGSFSARYIKQHPELRKRLIENAILIRTGVKELGFSTTDDITPIIPVFLNEQNKAKDLSRYLEENGIIVPSINYPVKMDQFIVRITASASHTKDQIEKLLHILKNGEIIMEATKIKTVTIDTLNIPLEEPFTIAIGTKYNIENVLITITLENGIQGYGEAAPLEPINGENQATVLATLNSCKDFLMGKDVSEYRQISKHLKNVFWAQITARCAIEMAILDAYTKSLNLPLYKFLGGAKNKIETDYTIDIVPAATAKTNATKLSSRGYNTIKTKVGKNLIDDIDRILAIKDGAPNCGIMLDANQGYSPCEAVHFLEELEKNNIRPVLFEQPVIKHDLQGMKFVKNNTSIPVAADESVFTAADAIEIVRTGCADLINIKIMKSGIIEAIDIATIARNANIGLMIGCMLETKLGLGCSVHFAAGLGGFDFVDLDPHLDPEKDPFIGGPEFNEPFYLLSDTKAGIGISKK